MLKSAKHSKTVAAAERIRQSEAIESIFTRRRRFLSLCLVELTMRGGRDLSRSVRAMDLDDISILWLDTGVVLMESGYQFKLTCDVVMS